MKTVLAHSKSNRVGFDLIITGFLCYSFPGAELGLEEALVWWEAEWEGQQGGQGRKTTCS